MHHDFAGASVLMMRRLVWVVWLALLSTGCIATQFLSRNLAAFGQLRTVAHKIENPVRPEARLAVLWVGHATVLIQIDDKILLTDPVWTRTVGQISPRLVEPGVEVRHLPPLDAVLISHMHFDHLSLGSLEMIEDKVRWLGRPEGGLVYLTDFSFPAHEVPWWQTRVLPGDLKVTAVAVRHNGWRYGLDHAWREGIGYAAWVIEYHGITVYFGGDSALAEDAYRETARRFPTIDLALLPIAPIHPRGFMKRVHTDPWEALTAFEKLGATWMVPIHFDTFINSLDEPGEPTRVLEQAVKQNRIAENRVHRLAIGEQKVLISR